MATNKGTRSITTSTDFSHVIMMIILALCRRLSIVDNMQKRLVFYLGFVAFGSLLADCAPTFVRILVPFQTSKHSFLNQWFVKIGWFWTIVLLGPFIHMTSQVSQTCQSHSSLDPIRDATSPSRPKKKHRQEDKDSLVISLWNTVSNRHLMRLWLNTLFWYVSTSAFIWFEKQTSHCTLEVFEDEETCTLNGHKWLGFDISGHTFILLFSLLIIMEECSVMKNWEGFGRWLCQEQYERQRTEREDLPQHSAFVKYNIFIRVFFLALTALSLIWHFMLFQTILFYHTTFQKVVAYFWAVALWFVGYKILYTSKHFSTVFKVPTLPRLKE